MTIETRTALVEHELKTWPEYFRALADGSKTFEVRKDDRGFEVGHRLRLREWSPHSGGRYTGREEYRRITYVLRGFGAVEAGHVVLGLAALDASPPSLPTAREVLDLSILKEAARDTTLSDGAVRLLVLGLQEPTVDDMAWAKAALSSLEPPSPSPALDIEPVKIMDLRIRRAERDPR